MVICPQSFLWAQWNRLMGWICVTTPEGRVGERRPECNGVHRGVMQTGFGAEEEKEQRI